MRAGSPGPIIGYSPTSFMNLLHTIAVYGTLCKALNLGAMRCGPAPCPRAFTPLQALMQQGTFLCCSTLCSHEDTVKLASALKDLVTVG